MHETCARLWHSNANRPEYDRQTVHEHRHSPEHVPVRLCGHPPLRHAQQHAQDAAAEQFHRQQRGHGAQARHAVHHPPQPLPLGQVLACTRAQRMGRLCMVQMSACSCAACGGGSPHRKPDQARRAGVACMQSARWSGWQAGRILRCFKQRCLFRTALEHLRIPHFYPEHEQPRVQCNMDSDIDHRYAHTLGSQSKAFRVLHAASPSPGCR